MAPSVAKAFQQALAKERSRRAAVAESSGGGEGELLDMDGKPLQLLTPDGRPMVYRAEASLQPEFEDFRDSFQGTCNSIDDMLGDDCMSSFGSMGGGSGGAGSNPLHGGGGIARRAPPSNLPQMTAKDWARIRNARDPTSGGKQAIGRAEGLFSEYGVDDGGSVGGEEEGGSTWL